MNILTYSLIFIAIIALSRYLTTKSNKPALVVSGGRILKADKVLGYMGFLSILLGTVFPVLYYIDVYNRDTKFLIASIFMLVIFSLIGLYMVLYYKNTRVEFNETMVKSTNFLGNSKKINWSDIKNIKYLATAKWLSLRNGVIKVNVPVILKGFGQFKKELTEKVSTEKYQEAFSKLNL
ncbi:MAG: hypothetical protein QG640_144 [Patescibacteria group bacterium]|nr:hypothetical protein [Patescibacteria group bacterium]